LVAVIVYTVAAVVTVGVPVIEQFVVLSVSPVGKLGLTLQEETPPVTVSV